MTNHIAVEMTVEQLRQLTETLPGDTTLRVGIRDDHHFNRFLGSLPVASARIERVANGHTVILNVPGVS